MRVRKRDANGDYTFGQGSLNFWINQAQGVGQKVTTRLGLWTGEWWLDKTVGTPWNTDVLGYGTVSLRDIAIKSVILNTRDSSGNLLVTSIQNYSGVYDPIDRAYVVSGSILTIYDPKTPVPFGPVQL